MMIGYVLLALGVAVFVLSFVIPAKTEKEAEVELSEDMIRDMVGREVENAKGQISDIVDETVNYAIEKTERSMDRLTNEKMMAVNEYSDTVLSEINKNHQEVVFLYDMLNDKHENLKNTVSEVDKKTSEVKQTIKDAELTAANLKLNDEEAVKPLDLSDIATLADETDISAPSPHNETENPDNADISPDEDTGSFFMDEVEKEPEYPLSNGRISAIDRLRAASTAQDYASDDFKPIIVERADSSEEIGNKPKKKRTSRSKPADEKKPVSEAESELINYVAKGKEDAPEVNLGDSSVGRTGGRNNNDRILELHNAGKSNMAIAKELGLGIGEVKLVIDLFEGM